jgi:hypothetical protein
MWCPQFLQLANLAGALLPRWPGVPYSAPLEHLDTWDRRLARRREIAAQTFVLDLGDGRTQEVPAAELADREWREHSPFDPFSRPVTDDRGNAERWIGFVLEALMCRDPEALDVRLGPDHPEAHVVGPWNCVVTLKEMDLFGASAQVIAWMLPSPSESTPIPATIAAAREGEQDFEPSERQDAIISSMYELGANSERCRRTRRVIASKVQRGLKGSSIGTDFVVLKEKGFLRAREGNRGGCWLTDKGIARAKQNLATTTRRNP